MITILIISRNKNNIVNYKNILTTTNINRFLITNSYSKINNIINNNAVNLIITDSLTDPSKLFNTLKKNKTIAVLFVLPTGSSSNKVKSDSLYKNIEFIANPINKKTFICMINKLLKSNLKYNNTTSEKTQYKLKSLNSNNDPIYILGLDRNYNIVMENSLRKKPLSSYFGTILNKDFIKLLSPYINPSSNIKDELENNRTFKFKTVLPDKNINLTLEWSIIAINTKSNPNFICLAKKAKNTKVNNKNKESDIIESTTKINNNLKDKIIDNMNHELRTPLNSIIGFSKLLKSVDNSNINKNDIINYSTYIHNNALRLLNSINKVVDTAKIELGKIKINTEKIMIKEYINEILLPLKNIANQNNIKIYFNPDSDIDSIISDSEKLNTILYNILSNAIKYNKVNGKIFISYSKSGYNNILFSIKDTGIGIKSEYKNSIFKEFAKAGENNYLASKRGIGLGLTICKKLINLMGGDIWLNSIYGQETTFYFTLPVQLIISKNKELNTMPNCQTQTTIQNK